MREKKTYLVSQLTLLILKTVNKLIELLPLLEVAAAEAMISHQQLPDPVKAEGGQTPSGAHGGGRS